MVGPAPTTEATRRATRSDNRSLWASMSWSRISASRRAGRESRSPRSVLVKTVLPAPRKAMRGEVMPENTERGGDVASVPGRTLPAVDSLPRRSVHEPGPPRGIRPAQWVALGFLAAIAVGTVLLALPASHAEGASIGVLALIQVGGLGILTLGALAAMIVGGRVGYRQRMQLQAQVNALHVGGIVRLVRNIFVLAVVTEVILTLILWTRMAPRHGVWDGLWHAAFHDVSAFNNAGFSTYADSLAGFAGDVTVLLVVAVGFVVGGLGHQVLIEVGRLARRARRRLTLHARLVLGVSAGLLALATLAVAALEWTNPATLGPLATGEKLVASFFQGATPRTAGFNSVDTGSMRPATLVVTMLLMFVGGSPGSTAGGIKTVTFFVLAGSAWSCGRP